MHSNNRISVLILNKVDSSRSTIRQEITAKILEEMSRRNCSFEVQFIPGRKNALADFLSLNDHLMPTETQIAQEA